MKIFESITSTNPIHEANSLIRDVKRYKKNLDIKKIKDRSSAYAIKESISNKLDKVIDAVPFSKLIENHDYIVYTKQLKAIDIMLMNETFSVDPKTGVLMDKSEKKPEEITLPKDSDVENDIPDYGTIGDEYDNRDPYHPEKGETIKAGKEYKSDLEASTGSEGNNDHHENPSDSNYSSMKLDKSIDFTEEQDEFYVTSKKQARGEKIDAGDSGKIPVLGMDQTKKTNKSKSVSDNNSNDDSDISHNDKTSAKSDKTDKSNFINSNKQNKQTSSNTVDSDTEEDNKDDEKMKKQKEVKESFSYLMESEMEKAELAIAARAMSDNLQTMAEKLGNMLVDDLMPITDQMKQVFSIDEAKRFGDEVSQKIQTLLDQTRETKDTIDRNVLVLTGEAQPESDMEMSDKDFGADLDMEEPDVPDLNMEEPEDDNFELAQPEGREMREQYTRKHYNKVMERYNELKRKGLL